MDERRMRMRKWDGLIFRSPDLVIRGRSWPMSKVWWSFNGLIGALAVVEFRIIRPLGRWISIKLRHFQLNCVLCGSGNDESGARTSCVFRRLTQSTCLLHPGSKLVHGRRSKL